MPRVSIGLPVYNGEPYLVRALDSILAQTFDGFELIICDNASTDRTREICLDYAARDPRIRYRRNASNVGAARNFNVAFELAEAEYFKWIAADDEIAPTFLEECVEQLERDPELVLATSQYRYRDEIEDAETDISYDHDLRDRAVHRRFRRLLLQPQGAEHPVWGVFRTAAFARTRRYCSVIRPDLTISVEMALQGPWAQVPDHLHLLRIHPQAYSVRSNIENVETDGMQGIREAQWIDPAAGARNYLPYWRLLREYAGLVIRADASAPAKVSMVATLARVAIARWRVLLIKELFFAAGLGRVYVRVRDVLKRERPQVSSAR